MTHNELCQRAQQWLRGTKRCDPVLGGIASCHEVPDAIGWNAHGSIVVECKTTLADFFAEKQKYVRYRRESEANSGLKGNGCVKELLAAGYTPFTIPNMGDYRYFLCQPDVLEAAHLEDRSDHGLLHVTPRGIRVIVEAPKREQVNLKSEIRCLRFALVHFRDKVQSHGFAVDLVDATKMCGKGITPAARESLFGT